jgi:hypothetical protein
LRTSGPCLHELAERFDVTLIEGPGSGYRAKGIAIDLGVDRCRIEVSMSQHLGDLG